MKHIFLLFFLSVTFLGHSQPDIQWQTSFGGSGYDIAYSVIQTADGGYIVAGSSNSSSLSGQHGGDDVLILKLGADGGLKWRKLLGGTGNDRARCIRQTIDGGYFIAGFTESNNFDVSGNHGGFFDGWFVKLDPNGNIQWQRTLGGSGWDDILAAVQTNDQGYVLTGRSGNADGDISYNHGFTDLWVVKLSPNGAIEWEKSYGGGLEEAGYGIKQTTDGGYIVAGLAYSTDGMVVGQHGNGDYWALKLSPTGVLEWQKAMGGSGLDNGSDVVETFDGGFAMIGYCGSNNGDVTGHFGQVDFWVTMLDGLGNLKWEKSLGGTLGDWGRAIVATGDGGVIVAGTTRSSDGDVQNNDGGSEFWLAKLNKHGQLAWEKTYGGTSPEECYTFAKTSDGGLIAAGYSWSSDGDVSGTTNMGKADVWIVKLGSETVGLEDLTEYPAYPLELYPNPAGDEITLNVEGGHSNVQLTLRDLRGAQVLQETASGFATVSIAHLKPGVYFATAVSSDGKVYCKKFEKL